MHNVPQIWILYLDIFKMSRGNTSNFSDDRGHTKPIRNTAFCWDLDARNSNPNHKWTRHPSHNFQNGSQPLIASHSIPHRQWTAVIITFQTAQNRLTSHQIRIWSWSFSAVLHSRDRVFPVGSSRRIKSIYSLSPTGRSEHPRTPFWLSPCNVSQIPAKFQSPWNLTAQQDEDPSSLKLLIAAQGPFYGKQPL